MDAPELYLPKSIDLQLHGDYALLYRFENAPTGDGGGQGGRNGGAMAWTFGRPIRIYIVLNGVLARSWPWQSYLLADAIICFAFDYS